jgi:Cu-Zn family superoxide dismutase
MTKRTGCAVLLVCFITGCSGSVGGGEEVQSTVSGSSIQSGPDQWGAQSPLVNARGEVIGTVQAKPSPGGVALGIVASKLPPGTHGMHIHTTGRCDAPDFSSAGPHWNPAGRQHGEANRDGPHLGDLGNVTIMSDGSLASTTLVLKTRLTTAETGQHPVIIDPDGASLIIHADEDDRRTDPSGNSGPRIACAVIRA